MRHARKPRSSRIGALRRSGARRENSSAKIIGEAAASRRSGIALARNGAAARIASHAHKHASGIRPHRRHSRLAHAARDVARRLSIIIWRVASAPMKQ